MAEEQKEVNGQRMDGSEVTSNRLGGRIPRRSSNSSESSTTSLPSVGTSKRSHRATSNASRSPSAKTTRKDQLISENCKKFNSLFHCSSGSEDSASSSDTVLTTTKDTTTPSNSGTGSIDKSSINLTSQYFNHDAINSPFKPATSCEKSRKTSAVNVKSKTTTNHGISQLLSTIKPLADPAVCAIKAEIKQEKLEENIGNISQVINKPGEIIKKEIGLDSSSCYVKLEEAEVQASMASTPDDSNVDGDELMDQYDFGDSEDSGKSRTQSDEKKMDRQMDKESKKLALQLTDNEKRKSSRLVSKTTFCNKKHEAQIMKRLKQIIKKPTDSLTAEERELKDAFPQLVRLAKKRLETRIIASERLKEFEDSPEELEIKCTKLAKVIKNAKYLVVYTGAGISTSASIPDYRGPNGIWTKLRNGESLDAQSPTVLTTADPTITHMALKQLHSERIMKHIVSQNCDGLHLRSGIPKNALSEVHGNMYIEVCIKCSLEYVRNFDVTENTRRYEHRTGRHCYFCGSQLKDTVVHFGERGSLRWPLNWAGAEYNVSRADVILCMGSSLKVLRRYPWLWGMDLPFNKRPKLYIVNLQWTPKDQFAALKIHGKCDEVMGKVMSKLNIPIPSYERETDQIFALATPLHESEAQSKSSVELAFPPDKKWPTHPPDLNNYTRFEPKFIPADLKIKKEEGEPSQEETEKLSKCDSRLLRSRTKAKSEDNKKDANKSFVKKRDKSTIIKGNGNGWFGNAWGKCAVKAKKRKTSTSTAKPNEIEVTEDTISQQPCE